MPPLPTVDGVVNAIWNSGFMIAAEEPAARRRCRPSIRCRRHGTIPGHFRKAAADHLARIGPRISAVVHPAHHDERDGRHRPGADESARGAREPRARGDLDGRQRPAADGAGVTPVGTETVMMAPSFPQPMYEALKEKSQDLLLPGLDKVLPDTVLGLRTNRAFVEAYMIGLNVEMARELLWRGFPTDQRGTYFRNFWGNRRRPRRPPATSAICARTWHARSAQRRRTRRRTSSCCCCAAACCAAIRTRSSI